MSTNKLWDMFQKRTTFWIDRVLVLFSAEQALRLAPMGEGD
jgi:hypothetical protein